MSVKASAGTSLDGLLAMKQEMVDRKLVLQGEFEDEIKRLTAVKAEVEMRMGAITSIEEANHFRETWQATNLKGAKEYDALIARGEAIVLESQARADELVKAKADAENLATEAAQTIEEYTTRKAQLEAQYAAKDAEIAKREVALQTARDQLNADQGALNSRAAALKAKIDAVAQLPV